MTTATKPQTYKGFPLRSYTDPYPGQKGTDRVQVPCECGDGLYHAPSGYVIQNPYGRRGDTIKGCFACMGTAKVSRAVSTLRADAKRVAFLRDYADELRAWADAERAHHIAREHAEELAAAWDDAHREQARRAALVTGYAAEVGEKVVFEATVTVATTFEVRSFNGYGMDLKALVVLTLDNGQVLKTMGTGASLYRVERGARVQVTGTVKSHDTYRGQDQTVLKRVKLVDAS